MDNNITVASNNLNEDMHILMKTLEQWGVPCLTRSINGLTQYCVMTESKVHFIIPIKLDGEEWNIAYQIRGLHLIPYTIMNALRNPPTVLSSLDVENICVVQFGHVRGYYAFNYDDFSQAVDEVWARVFGKLTKDEGAPWFINDILAEAALDEHKFFQEVFSLMDEAQ